MRKLTKLPRNKCWFVGSSKLDAVDVAINFNKSWETHLRIGQHDCRDYTNGNRLSMFLQIHSTYTYTPFLNICNKFESHLGVNNSSIFCSEGLVERLTGRKLVLEHIRSVAGQS